MKMCRHVATASTPWPKAGARIGTIMNTIITSDMIRAIPEPW